MNNLSVPKWFKLVITLYNIPDEQRYSQRLQNKIHITSTHLRKLLFVLESRSIVSRTRVGKIQYIVLTSKGKDIAEMLLKIRQEVNSDESFEKRQ
jgi:DNA-binding HxlR family transcriptional regulator